MIEIIGALIVALFASPPPDPEPIRIVEVVQAEELPATSTMSVSEKIRFYADLYRIDYDSYHRTILCESSASTTVQSGFYHNGVREESWGIAQINLPSHPSISKEQALDPDFSLDFMAGHFAAGRQWMWTCYGR